MALEELANVSGSDLGGGGGGGGGAPTCLSFLSTYPWDVVSQGRWGTCPDWGWGSFQSRVEEAPPSSTGGFAQSPQVNAINDKSCPNLTMSIHDSSDYGGGVDQIPLANAINDRSHPTIHQVTLEVLPKFYRQMILMTSLVPIRP